MKILDRLPISGEDSLTLVGTESVRLKKDEIIVWVSVTLASVVQSNPTIRHFPVILDTGHTHNFAIQNQHLARWAGIQPEMLRPLGHIRHDKKRMPLYELTVWLHGNQRGKLALSPKAPLQLELPDGIAVHPDGANYPRLPIVGLRAILSNHLYLAVNGKRRSVTLRSADWRTSLLSCLA